MVEFMLWGAWCAVILHLVTLSTPAQESVQQRDVVLTNRSVVLRGTLKSPVGSSNYPTVLMVHGSAPDKRSDFPFASELVQAGIAVFTYDKRGVGESTGNWKTSSLTDLAGDAAAAVAHLREQLGIRRIGLWGGSQGGWIVPTVAALDTNIAFVISISAPAMTPAEQMLFAQENNWRKANLSLKQLELLQSAWRAFYAYAAFGLEADELDLQIVALEKDPVLDARRPLKSTELKADSPFRLLNYGYDALPFWSRVRCPVLCIWGEGDELVPSRKSRDMIQAALQKSGQTNFVLKIFPEANHGLQIANGTRKIPEGWVPNWQWAPGYVETVVNWLKAQ